MASTFRPSLRWGSMAVLSFILVTQFINCGSYTSPTTTTTSNSDLTCDDTTCLIPDPDNLKLVFNLNGQAEYLDTTADFNLGGDCNEGGYPYNTIYWELYLNGTKVRDSNMTGMIASNAAANANTMCVNGRFSMYVNLNPIAQDNVNRVGLLTGDNNPANRADYDLYATIIGRPTSATSGFQNTLTGRGHITLVFAQ